MIKILSKKFSSSKKMPLEGVWVIDASRILVGSYATL